MGKEKQHLFPAVLVHSFIFLQDFGKQILATLVRPQGITLFSQRGFDSSFLHKRLLALCTNVQFCEMAKKVIVQIAKEVPGGLCHTLLA